MAIEPTLYIIMRSDIPDMNPGKGFAQAAHANGDFDGWVSRLDDTDPVYLKSDMRLVRGYIVQWKEGRNFGRTLSLSATREEIINLVSDTPFGGLTIDPTYPWRNFYGDLFLSNEVTCGWLFVCDLNPLDKEAASKFSLHK